VLEDHAIEPRANHFLFLGIELRDGLELKAQLLIRPALATTTVVPLVPADEVQSSN